MRGLRKHFGAGVVICAIFLSCALFAVFSGIPASSPAGEGNVEKAEASAFSVANPDDLSPGTRVSPVSATGGSDTLTVAAPAAAPETPVQQEPPLQTDAPPQIPDEPSASAVDPSLPAPAGFTATFNYGWLQRRAELAWNGVVHPQLAGYYVVRWAQDDFVSLLNIFQQLAALNPAAAPYAGDMQAQFVSLSQGGLTYTEKNATMDRIEADLDQLFSILFATPGTESLVQQLIGLADIAQTTSTAYLDTSFTSNYYYLYVVAARYSNGDTSVPSNSGGVFTVRVDWTAPAAPAGFAATAYDPGAALEWSRNTEADLAGYNVYLRQGGSDILLNPSPITSGTEFFDLTGVEGATYRVRAVDLWNRTSNPTSATAVLAPATVYDADSAAWSYSGSWAREDYRGGDPPGGGLLRVGHWGDAQADPPLARASVTLTFSGRRIRVYSARYYTCGNVNVYVDGIPRATFNLYYDGGYYTGPYGQGTYIPPLWQQMSFEITGLSKGQHTLLLEAVGSGGAEGQHFINFEYAESR
ncbi:MAG: hypothetical protein C4536_02555 [Actinobacteria bacterium]|jgi:hypothetical protein|nr:MAG: hypothetical protein C4536_02555 [Actinomycetota bacterium]